MVGLYAFAFPSSRHGPVSWWRREDPLASRNLVTMDYQAKCIPSLCSLSCVVLVLYIYYLRRHQFNGGVVVVTHDARLIEATECRLWIVDEQEVTPWQGEISHRTEHIFTRVCCDEPLIWHLVLTPPPLLLLRWGWQIRYDPGACGKQPLRPLVGE